MKTTPKSIRFTDEQLRYLDEWPLDLATIVHAALEHYFANWPPSERKNGAPFNNQNWRGRLEKDDGSSS